MKGYTFPISTRKGAITDYNLGMPHAKIEKKWKVSRSIVCKWVVAAGFKLRRKRGKKMTTSMEQSPPKQIDWSKVADQLQKQAKAQLEYALSFNWYPADYEPKNRARIVSDVLQNLSTAIKEGLK